MPDRFLYHALTTGVSGRIDSPFQQIIPVQASLALPETGGFGTTRVDHFSIPGIISFSAAYSMVAGSYGYTEHKGGSYDAVATVTIEGLNILSVLTADRVVARIASSHPEDRNERSITPLGSTYENLSIAGSPVRVHLATDTFTKFNNADKVRAAYRDNTDQFREEFDALAQVGQGDSIPQHLRSLFPWCSWLNKEEIPETNGIISGSLVRRIEVESDILRPCGHVIPVPGFGRIRLAEFKLTDSFLQVSMLEVELGSTPVGRMSIGGAKGNGSDW